MIKMILAIIDLALLDLFDSTYEKSIKQNRDDSSIEFFFEKDSNYKMWLKYIGIKSWIHPIFLLSKFQIKSKKIREAISDL